MVVTLFYWALVSTKTLSIIDEGTSDKNSIMVRAPGYSVSYQKVTGSIPGHVK
jgi:hypothetical protein